MAIESFSSALAFRLHGSDSRDTEAYEPCLSKPLHSHGDIFAKSPGDASGSRLQAVDELHLESR